MASWVPSAVSAVAGCALSAVSAIAGSAASTVIERIVYTGFSYLRNRMLAGDSEAELKRLEMALPQIRDVMNVAEALKMKDPSSGEWFVQLRNAVDASEDVLDELEYKKLEDMAKNRHEAGRSASCSRKKNRSCLISGDTLSRLRDAVRMLDEAAANVNHIHRRAADLGVHGISDLQQTSMVLNRETTCFLTERKVVGRNIEKQKIIDWLEKQYHDRLSCFGIIGAGGLGKTTLAQFAYQEMNGSNQFDKRIWVCVSTNFSVEHITQKILCELGENNYEHKTLNALQESLKEKIHSKKIFLVLDDIWDDDKRSDWEQLFAPLQFVQQGSKILFTTRMKSVAYLLDSVIYIESELLVLRALPMKDLLELFNNYAFHGFNADNYENLQSIGNQMVKLLKGSPLAAKVIGSLLNSRMDYSYWRRVFDGGSLFNLDQASNVMEVLKLSYYHLPANLQVCFRFCSIFPQDYNFNKNELIKMWMAAGFLKHHFCDEENLEDVGEDYFNHLLRKSFFESSYSDPYNEKCFYNMHDLMHDLAQNVSYGECCRVELNDKLVVIPSSVRHISIHENEIERISHLENLHSLIITSSRNVSSQLDSFVLPTKLNKRSLRLLRISSYHSYQLSEEISHSLHLRYISIALCRGSRPKCLVNASIHNLYHLQLLEFSGPTSNQFYLGIDPIKMSNLVRLRYIRLPVEITKTIPRIHKLISLRELTFSVGKKSGHGINELRTLNNLCSLSIYNIENVRDPAEAKSADLLGKENLKSLSLEWTSNNNSDNPELVLDKLQPNPNLMALTIKNYTGQRSPSWMKDSSPLNLSVLELRYCPVWKDQFFCCQMPYLKYLYIFDCPKLDRLPDMPLSLVSFIVQNVGLTRLPRLYQSVNNNTMATVTRKSSLRVVTIGNCPNLISLDGFLHQGGLNLQAIEKLTITKCKRLVDLPIQVFGNLTSLEYLSLEDCPNMVVMDSEGNLLPEKLRSLDMDNCGELDVPLLKASSGLTTLTYLRIAKCTNVTSLIVAGNSFKSLKSLSISSCDNLVELLFLLEADRINQENSFNVSKMDNLKIEYCPKLTRLPVIPLSLTMLEMRNVVLGALPEYYHTSSNLSGGSSTASLKSLLKQLRIENFPQLTSLNGFFQQECSGFQSIKEMYISDCINLVQLPIAGFRKFVSLEHLIIWDCPMLVEGDNQSNILPMTLKELTIGNCGELDMQLLESASRLTTLTYLHIENCANITHIPCSKNAFITLTYLHIENCANITHIPCTENAFTALTYLHIENCANITHIPCSKYAFRSLNSLRIRGCDKLVKHSSMEPEHGVNLDGSKLASLKINSLSIDHLSLLLIEPLRNLRFVSELTIGSCLGMDVFPEEWLVQNSSTLRYLRIAFARTLKSLPATIARFTVFTELHILGCNLLEEIQELPTSLRILKISGAKSLKSLPASIVSLTVLEELRISGPDLLEEIPELPASLRILSIKLAKSLKSLPATMSRLTALEDLTITEADLLDQLPELPHSLKFKSIRRSDGTELYT